MDYSNYFAEEFARIQAELFALLAFESVGSEKERFNATVSCAQWLREHLAQMGFTSELLPVPDAPPVVFASLHIDDSYPTVLLYGHYDLQPTGDIERWQSHPFRPEVRAGRIYARGARDNKGQFFFNLKAIEAAQKTGALRYNVKVFLDGEEESASLNTLHEIPVWKAKLQCDVVMASETQGGSDGTPAIIMGYRGIAYMRLNLYGANRTLHSGHYGGIVRNPAVEMSRLVSSMFHADGRIAVSGYLDDVAPVSNEERELLKRSCFNEAELLQNLGIDAFYGDPNYSVPERVAFLPAIEFPGISGGYIGRAVRATIPSMAQLKMTLRTARGQDGERLIRLISDHLQQRVPAGVRLEIEKRGVICPALSANPDSKVVQKCSRILEKQAGVAPGFLWVGATLSAIASIVAQTGAEPLLVGFGLPEDAEHGENESFAISQFRKGFLYAAAFLSEGP